CDGFACRRRLCRERGKALAHAGNRPEEIYGCWARGSERIADQVEFFGQIRNRCSVALFHAERDTHIGRNSDSRSAAYDHRGTDVRYLLLAGSENVCFFERQLRLVEEADTILGPFKCRNHAGSSLLGCRVQGVDSVDCGSVAQPRRIPERFSFWCKRRHFWDRKRRRISSLAGRGFFACPPPHAKSRVGDPGCGSE